MHTRVCNTRCAKMQTCSCLGKDMRDHLRRQSSKQVSVRNRHRLLVRHFVPQPIGSKNHELDAGGVEIHCCGYMRIGGEAGLEVEVAEPPRDFELGVAVCGINEETQLDVDSTTGEFDAGHLLGHVCCVIDGEALRFAAAAAEHRARVARVGTEACAMAVNEAAPEY